MKKGLHIVFWILALLILVLAAGVVAIQSPKVQTLAGQKVLERLQEQLDADVSFSNLTIRPFDAVLLEDVLILDRAPAVEGMDTLLQVKKLSAKFSVWGLLQGDKLIINYAKLDGGLFNLALEKDPRREGGMITNLQRVLRMYPDDNGEPMHWGNLLQARSVDVKNVRFRMENQILAERMAKEGQSYGEGVIDWNHLNLTLDELHVSKLKIADNLILGKVDELRLREHSTGFNVKEAQAESVMVGNQNVTIKDLHLSDYLSDLYLNQISFDGPLENYGYFTEKIKIGASIDGRSLLDIRTLTHFGPGLSDYFFRGKLSGGVEGCVKNLALSKVQIIDQDNTVSLRVNGRFTGLPEISDTEMKLDVKDLIFNFRGLAGFVRGWSPLTDVSGMKKLAPGQLFTFTGQVQGPLNELAVNGNIDSDSGSLRADLKLRNVIESQHPLSIGGKISTDNLNIGRIAGVQALGPVTLQTGLEASFQENGPQVRLDSLKISRLSALGYNYSGISAVGSYREDAFDGRITSADPNLNFLFQGVFNLSKNTKNAAYNFFLSLGYADLHALHIDKREQSKISFVTNANFLRTEERELIGSVNMSNLVLESASGVHNLGNVNLRANTNDNLHRLRLDSGFMEASFVGDHPVAEFVKDLQRLIIQRDLPALTEEEATPFSGASYTVSAKIFDATQLLDFLSPGLYVENKTKLSLQVKKDGLVSMDVNSGRIALKDKYAKGLKLRFDNLHDVLSGELSSETIAVAGALLKNNRLSLFADDNHIGLGYIFDNESDPTTKAEIYLSGDLSRDEDGLGFMARALPSNVYYNGDGWAITSGDIGYKGGDISVSQLLARHEGERLAVNGGFSPTKTDTLSVTLEKFNLALLNSITGGSPSLEGRATGKALVLSPSKPTPGLLAGIVCDSTRVSGKRMGQVNISSVWDEQAQRFNASLSNSLDGRSTLDADAYLVPAGQKLHAALRLDGFEMGYAESLASVLFSEFGGKLSGEITADGTLGQIHLGSKDLRLKDGRMTLDYTRAPYKVEGSLALDNEGLKFTDISLADGEGGTGRIRGSILLGDFSDIKMDTHVFMREMRALALPSGVNPILYGDLYATGRVDITGPLDKIYLGIDAITAKQGNLHIPLDSPSGRSRRELLSFKEEESLEETDPYELMMASNRQSMKRSSDLQMKLRVQPTADSRVYLDIDEDNSLNAVGTGTIEMETSTATGSFTMNGNYDISDGSFHFSAMNLVNRNFTIQDGSTVRFNGDVMDTDLDVKGLYVTKASLANLISEEASVSRRTVNCGINITGKMRNPEVKFDIEVPDLNPIAQAQVESALNSEDKVQKQFVYLLVAGNFLPTEESGITTNGSEVLFSNVSSIMSGQLNNIFQKLNIPLDLGLNYQATQTGSNLFDVALSTQLFNNRVLVNGTVGNRQLIGGTTTNEIAGDIDIEIKLNRSGSMRLNLFSHSADQFTYYLDNSQRNGAGIAYQREFNSISDFFRDLFTSRRTREERARNSLLRQGRSVVLQIDSTGKASNYDLR